MVRILQAVGLLALIGAGFILSLCAASWLCGAPQPEPGSGLSVAERFRQNGGGKRDTPEAFSPLVAQAAAFASYLQPPEPGQVNEVLAPKSAPRQDVAAVELPQTTPKFTLLATSYYRDRPEESLALVSEPGRGTRWVAQGARLGHFIVEEIRQRVIVCRDGRQQCQIAMETGAPADTQPGQEKTLAAGSAPEPSMMAPAPESIPAEKVKTRPRQPMHKLGPLRQEIHVVAYNHPTTSG